MVAQNSPRRDFWFVVCAAISWGTVGVATQTVYAQSATNALSLAFFRLGIAVPLFWLAGFLLLGRRMLRVKRRDLMVMVLMGGMQALYQVCYTAAIAYVGVTVSTLIALCVAPVLVALFSIVVARERLTMATLIALVCALGGTMLLVTARSDISMGSAALAGIVLALLSAAGYAGFLLLGRPLTSRYHSLHVNAVAFGVGALLLLAFASSARLVFTYPVWGWFMLLYLGCIPTAVAYGLFQTGIRSLSATVVSIVTLCEPLTAALLAWLFFHEELGPSGFIGAALLLSAMLLLMPRKKYR